MHEGEVQFTNGGYQTSSIQFIERPPGKSHSNLALGSLRGHGASGVEVSDCGHSKIKSKGVETGLHGHYRKIARQSGGKLKILWKVDGAGSPRGIGPYVVCARIVPLPLPAGMHITVAQ